MATPNPMPVKFHGSTLYVIDHNGEPFVPMKPVVEGMGMDWKAQFDKLRGSRFSSCVGEITTQPPGHKQGRRFVCLPLRKLPGWLMSIHPNKVKAGIREKVIQFQNECDDVLWRHWQKRHPESTPMIKPEGASKDSQWVEGNFNGHRIRALVSIVGGWEVCLEDCGRAIAGKPIDLARFVPHDMLHSIPPEPGKDWEDDPMTLARPAGVLAALVRSHHTAAPALIRYLENELFLEGRISAEFTPTRADLDYARDHFEQNPMAFLGNRTWLLRADPQGGLHARAMREGEVIMEMSELEGVKRAYDTLDELVKRRELNLAFPRSQH